jgi:hypothetical protein
MKITQTEYDNGEPLRALNTPGTQLLQWRQAYRSISDLLRDLECPDVFRHLAKTDHAERTLRGLRDRWIKLGRPELAWPGIRLHLRVFQRVANRFGE